MTRVTRVTRVARLTHAGQQHQVERLRTIDDLRNFRLRVVVSTDLVSICVGQGARRDLGPSRRAAAGHQQAVPHAT